MKLHVSLFLVAITQNFSGSFSFVNQKTTSASFVSTASNTLSSSVFDDFEEFSPENNDSNSDEDFYSSLRARQASFSSSIPESLRDTSGDQDESSSILSNWKEANCVSTVGISFSDWVRRLAIDTYPLAVCGSALGSLFLADLKQGEELDCLERLHIDQANSESPSHIDEALENLYGTFDGGGVIALAIKDDMIVSSGREGGVQVCAISGEEEEVYKGSRGGTSKQTKLSLERKGRIRGLEMEDNVLITSLAFDDGGNLWVGGYDGVIRGYDHEEKDAEGRPAMLRQKHPLHRIDCGSGVVSLSINNDVGCGIASTISDGIVLFSLEDGEILDQWNPFVKKTRKEFPRCATVVQNNKGTLSGADDVWSVVVGGSRGSLFQRRLNVDRTGYVSESQPFYDQTKGGSSELPIKLRPSHLSTVVDIATPAPGLFVTGAHDGSMRVWDCSTSRVSGDDVDDEDEDAQYDDIERNDKRPSCLYALSGYKVWLGSVFSNGKKLVSDGSDNTIIVHSFDEDEEDVLFREDDEDMEGFL